jgi:hypothetical protein
MTRRCWRSWQHIRWKLSPPCLPWRTNTPGLQRAVRGTLQLRQDSLRRVGPVSLPLAVARKRTRRTVASISRELGARSLQQQRSGARTPVASAHDNSAPTPGRAQFILGLATVPLSAARSRSSRSALAKGMTKPLGKAPPPPPPPARRLSKEKASDAVAAATERELGYQAPNKDLKGLFHQSDSESGGDEHRKKLYVMYGGSSELISRWDVKTLRREVLSVKPWTPKAAPHQRWKSTTISFGPSDYPENMAGAGVLPLVLAPTIANVGLHHVLINGGAGLSVISYAAFKHLQILKSKLAPSRPFSGVGPNPIYLGGTISLPVTFGTEVNFHTENVQFKVAEVNLPFNAIIGRPALYRFMAVAHYGYLVLKMPSPVGVLTVQSDRTAAIVAVEKLHTLAVTP